MLYCIDAPKPGDTDGVIWFWETITKGKGENAMKTTVAIVGLGSRGRVTYAPIAKQYPDLMEITALADINPACVEEAAKEYNVSKERCFTSAEELLAQPKLADAIFICTQDQDHVREALVALEKGYHILMEKPISPSAEDCNKLLEASRKYDRKIVVCHVLRYTPFFSKIKEIISEGIIGDVVTIQAIENVGYWHQAHSFVRGNWRNSNTTSPMCLQKTCHDFDLYLWLADKTPKRVSSMGDTYFFKEACAPEGAALRCMDGCKAKENCPFDAEKFISPTSVPASHRATPNGRLTSWQFIRQRKASMKRSRQALTDAAYSIATTTL